MPRNHNEFQHSLIHYIFGIILMHLVLNRSFTYQKVCSQWQFPYSYSYSYEPNKCKSVWEQKASRRNRLKNLFNNRYRAIYLVKHIFESIAASGFLLLSVHNVQHNNIYAKASECVWIWALSTTYTYAEHTSNVSK